MLALMALSAGGPGLGVAQLRLGLALELDVPHLHGQDHREALPEVLARQGRVLVLQNARPAAVVVHALGERRLEAGLVGTALGGGDVVHVGEQVLVVPVVVLDGEIHQYIAALAADVDGRVVKGGALAVQIPHEVGEAALEAELVLPALLPGPLILQRQLHAPVQVRQLPQPPHDHVVVPFHGLEDPIVGHKGDEGPLLPGPTRLRQRVLGPAGDDLPVLALGALELLLIGPVLGEHLHGDPPGQGVHHRRAHAVEAAGVAVGVVAELAARMELGKDHLHAGHAQLLVDAHGDASSIVEHGGGAVLVQGHVDLVGVAVGRLVDGVVHDLPQQVVEPLGARGAYIHAGTHANRVQALHDRYVGNGIVGFHILCISSQILQASIPQVVAYCDFFSLDKGEKVAQKEKLKE